LKLEAKKCQLGEVDYKGSCGECLLSRTKITTDLVKYVNSIMKIRTRIIGCPHQNYFVLHKKGMDYYALCNQDKKEL